MTISNFDANDQLVINGLAGNDTIDASTIRPNLLKVTLNGGDGDDLIVGSLGDDLVIGGRGNDTLFGDSGNDTFVWNPGDGSDIIEGQAGSDTLLFNGANINEKIDISANGSRVRFTRDVAAITMDVNGVENIQFNGAWWCRQHHGQRSDRDRRYAGQSRPGWQWAGDGGRYGDHQRDQLAMTSSGSPATTAWSR